VCASSVVVSCGRGVSRRALAAADGAPLPRRARTAGVLERILASVRRAPSAGFSQGQRLVVVTEPARRRAIADLLGETGSVAEGFEPWLSTAPVHVVVCTREADYHERYTKDDKLVEGREIEWPVPFWFVDAGAAMMALLMAAIDEGFASGFLGVPVEKQRDFRRLLELPDDVAVVGIATLGRAAPDPRWSAATSRATQPRRSRSELIHWERWNGSRAG
jgi:FMN reductase [NAD(P)H]